MLRKIVIALTILCVSVICIGETWRLGSNQQWQKSADSNESSFATIASDAKQFVSTGKAGKAKRAYADLKKNFPQVAGEDYDAYVKAELLYAKRRFPDAAKSYSDFLDMYPESSLRDAALEREFQIGAAFLNGQKRTVLKIFKVKAYDEGTEIMNQIADREGDAPISQRAITTLAQSNEKRGAYEEAYQAWSDASSRWPTGDLGRDSLLGMARSLEKDYRGPNFESKSLASSKSYYSQYIERYPESAQEMALTQKVSKLNIDLAEKELTVAKYYERTLSYGAADIYYQKIAEQWPGSNAAKIAESKVPVMEKLTVESKMPKKKKLNWKGLLL
ncbi:MAG: outer membrane protein assembly factor BamD [Planctomycetaceae bacterium]|nr:outer membrane protein assembly factor BamD [Planctomycetaceae bacterium]